MRFFWTFSIAATLWAATTAQALVVTEGGSTAVFDPAAGGVTSWVIDGVEQLSPAHGSLWYYRVGGAGGEASIGTLPSSETAFPPGSGMVSYFGTDFDVTFDVNIQEPVAGVSVLTVNAFVTSATGTVSPVELDLFQLTNADLDGVPGGDSVLFTTATNVDQTAPGATLNEILTANIAPFIDPVFEAYQADAFATLLAEMTDGSPTTLSDSAAFGPGSDPAYAVQFGAPLAPFGGGVLSITTVSVINTNLEPPDIIIPEPTSAGLAILAAAGLAIRRRRAGGRG